VVVVEGLYSMEGTYVDLPKLVELGEKYHFLLYVDEAHSIGAVGANGRGVVEHYGLDRSQVDFSMGTFTKSFGSIGGYVAGSKQLIEQIRKRSQFYN
jgi:serine palmitoyltransferase